jgi:hypothetical protein
MIESRELWRARPVVHFGGVVKAFRILIGKQKGRDHLEGQSICEMIILNNS